MNFYCWKWACKTRHWRRRPRRDLNLPFLVRDETETLPDFLESKTFQNSISRPFQNRDFMPDKLCMQRNHTDWQIARNSITVTEHTVYSIY